MVGSNFTATEYRKEIRRLKNNLGKRAKNIEGRGELAFQYLPQKLKELKGEHSQNLKDMDIKELRSYYRQLTELSQKKSSTVKGAIKAQEDFGSIANRLPNLTEEQKSTIFRLYGKAYELNIEFGTNYKYELLDVATDISEIYSTKSSEFVFDELLMDFENLENKQAELEKYNDELHKQNKKRGFVNVEETIREELLQIIHRLRQFYL